MNQCLVLRNQGGGVTDYGINSQNDCLMSNEWKELRTSISSCLIFISTTNPEALAYTLADKIALQNKFTVTQQNFSTSKVIMYYVNNFRPYSMMYKYFEWFYFQFDDWFFDSFVDFSYYTYNGYDAS